MPHKEFHADMFIKFFLPSVLTIILIITALTIIDTQHVDQFAQQCKDKQGFAIHTKSSQLICIKQDSIINL